MDENPLVAIPISPKVHPITLAHTRTSLAWENPTMYTMSITTQRQDPCKLEQHCNNYHRELADQHANTQRYNNSDVAAFGVYVVPLTS